MFNFLILLPNGDTVKCRGPKRQKLGFFAARGRQNKPIETEFLRFFGLPHLVVSPIGSSLSKLNTGAQLQTFPYATTSKSFLYSNAFMAKSGAQSLTFKSVRDKQTKKTQRPWSPWWRAKSEHHQTWHSDRGPRSRSCTSNFWGSDA